MKPFFSTFGTALALSVLSAAAQTGITRVAVHTDWSVFHASSTGSGFADCWSASEPRATKNTRGGKDVDVTRGEIQLMIAFTRGSASPQVAFTGGYPYADDGTVSATIDGKDFTLMTANQPDAKGETTGWAWPKDAADESRIVEAMKRGAEAVLTGRSSRGTTTRDTFSLLGFTAAIEAAQRECAS